MRVFHSTFMNLFVLFMLSSTFPLIITGWISYHYIATKLDRNLNVDTNAILSERIQALSSYIHDLDRMGDSIAGNSTVSAFLENKDRAAYPLYSVRLDTFIHGVSAIRPENVGITIITNNGLVYSYGYSLNTGHDKFRAFKWLATAERSPLPTYITSVHIRPYSNFNPNRPVFSFVRTLYSFNLKAKGELIIDFDTSSLNQFFNVDSILEKKVASKGSGIFVTDKVGNLIYSSGLANSIPLNHKIYEFIHQRDPQTGWTITAYFLKNQLFSSVYRLRRFTFYVALISTLICLLTSYLISQNISRPIRHFRNLMKEVELGNFQVHFESNAKDEIGRLGDGINHMLQKIRELIDLVYEEQNSKRRAELTALQSQINPHFLYNTLETINSLARRHNETEISRMIILLGKLLRNSASVVHDLIPISQELEHVKNYLDIHKYLIHEHISYEMDVSSDIQSLYTIKWILQPIVENSIVHGARNRPSKIKIHISGTLENDVVVLRVKDNGMGISEAKLKALVNTLSSASEKVAFGEHDIGLVNVQSRIRLYFGPSYGLYVQSKENEGATVVVRLPRRYVS